MINNLDAYILGEELENSVECSECGFLIDSDIPTAFHDLCNGCHEERNPLEYQKFQSGPYPR